MATPVRVEQQAEEKANASAVTPPRMADQGLWVISVIIAVAGVLDTTYLTVTKLTNTATICPQGEIFNCDLVQSSVYSKIAGMPIQFLGLAGFVAILALLLVEPRVPWLVSKGKLLVLGMTLFGFLFSAYLTAVEAFVLRAWCLWCVGSAIAMTLLLIVSSIRVWRSLTPALEALDAEA